MDILEKYRKQIDRIDNEIIRLINRRIKIADKIGKHKKKNNKKIYDKKREKEIFEKLKIKSEKNNLNKNHLNKIFRVIIKYSRENQR